MVVLCQDDEVIATHVAMLLHLVFLVVTCHIHLTTEDGLKGRFTFFLQAFVHFVTIVEKLLNTKHVAMVGHCHSLHTVGNGFVNKLGNGRLPVKNRVISVYVKVYKVFHAAQNFEVQSYAEKAIQPKD